MAPAGCRTHRHASHEHITKHDHLIHQHISHHVLAIPHHNMPCKNKLDVLYFVVANFTWLLWATSNNRYYLRKATAVIFKLPFNLLQGPPLSNPIQLKRERQTPASHLYANKLHVSRWNRSLVRGQVWLVRDASSHNIPESK